MKNYHRTTIKYKSDHTEKPETDLVYMINDIPPEQTLNMPNIEIVENRIYFYADVDIQSNLTVNKCIRDIGNQILWRAQTLSQEPGVIYLHINSNGGDLMSGLSIMDSILTSKVPIYTVVDGGAASAATIMSVVGSKRYMHKHSFMLIHQLSSGMWGKHNQLKEEMDNLDLFMKTIKNIYKKYTKFPMKELDKILKQDIWLDAETCIKYGLVDEIFTTAS